MKVGSNEVMGVRRSKDEAFLLLFDEDNHCSWSQGKVFSEGRNQLLGHHIQKTYLENIP